MFALEKPVKVTQIVILANERFYREAPDKSKFQAKHTQ